MGKTTFATLLASRALRHPSGSISAVVHIRESTACPDQTKSECYSDSHAEKNTRAAIKSEFDRAVQGGGTSTLVIVDSLNYIKGYRYELYCISKAAGERHGVVWVMGSSTDATCVGANNASDELAKKRNRLRKEKQLHSKERASDDAQNSGIDIVDGHYEDDAAMDALILRYEPPDEKNRWENPLYKVDVSATLPWGKDGTLEQEASELTDQMKGMEVKDATSQQGQSSEVTKPVKKSSSGFKRRVKKSASAQQQQAPMQQPQTSMSTIIPNTTPSSMNIPSSMASRNLQQSANETNGSESQGRDGNEKRRMESVIDDILNSFLTNTAPLQEGMSTLKQVSAESNVLNEADNLTQRVNNDILRAQKAASLASGVGGKIFVEHAFSNGKRGRRAMALSKPLYANELRNVRRQFLKWIAGHPLPEGTGEEVMVEAYIAYIESNI